MADAHSIFPALTVPVVEPQRADQKWKVGKYVFRADFDSANLGGVEQGANANEFHLWTKKDCQGTEYERGTRSWFYFGISGQQAGDVVVLQIMNLNNQGRLYKNDYRPWCWSAAHTDWQPTMSKVSYRREGDNFQLRFSHKFDGPEEMFFAFAIPFSYCDMQVMLQHVCCMHEQYQTVPLELFMHRNALPTAPASAADQASSPASPQHALVKGAVLHENELQCAENTAGLSSASSSSSSSSKQDEAIRLELQPSATAGQSVATVRQAISSAPKRPIWGASRQAPTTAHGRKAGSSSSMKSTQPPQHTAGTTVQRPLSAVSGRTAPEDEHARIYFHRHVLAYSPEGRSVDLITITDCYGASDTVEADVTAMADMDRDGVIGCDPGHEVSGCKTSQTTAVHFPGKQVFFISARVHPGETPATHMLNGMLAFLLRKDDARARMLRRLYVFKLVPCVNPDGVFWGNYRADVLGQNLNRHYANPCKVEHPGVWAIKKQLMLYAAQGTLDFYLDLHAHANKKGVFIYGNTLTGEPALASLVYTRLVALNSPVFDFQACNFTEKNMTRADKDGQSKEGAARVALFKEVQALPSCTRPGTHFYTVEANYNTARLLNPVAPACGDHNRCTTPPPARQKAPSKFTTAVLQGAGRALLVAALDLKGCNPYSRLPNSEHRSLEGVVSWLCAVIRSPSGIHTMHLPPLSDTCMASLRALPNSLTALPCSSSLSTITRNSSDSNIAPVLHSSTTQHAASNTSQRRATISCLADTSRVRPSAAAAVVDINQTAALRGQQGSCNSSCQFHARFAKSQGPRVLRPSASNISSHSDVRQLQTKRSAPEPAGTAAAAAAVTPPAAIDCSTSNGGGMPTSSPQGLACTPHLPKVQGSNGTSGIPSVQIIQARPSTQPALARSTSMPVSCNTLTMRSGNTGQQAIGIQKAANQPAGCSRPSGIPKPPVTPASTPAAAAPVRAVVPADSLPRPGLMTSSSASRHCSISGSTDTDAVSRTSSMRLAPISRLSSFGRGCTPVELNIRLTDPLHLAAELRQGGSEGSSRGGSSQSHKTVLSPPHVDDAWDGHRTANAAALVLASGPWQQKDSTVTSPSGSGRLQARLLAALQHQVHVVADGIASGPQPVQQPMDPLKNIKMLQEIHPSTALTDGMTSPLGHAFDKLSGVAVPPYLGLQVSSKPQTIKLGVAAGTQA